MMTNRVMVVELVVPTVLAVALAVVLSIAAVFLTEHYLSPDDLPVTQNAVTDSH